MCVLCACVLMCFRRTACQSLPLKHLYITSTFFDKSCVSIPPEHDANQQNVTAAPDCCIDRTTPRATASGLPLPTFWKSLLIFIRCNNWSWSCSFTQSCPRVYFFLSAMLEILHRVSFGFSLAHFSSADVCSGYVSSSEGAINSDRASMTSR